MSLTPLQSAVAAEPFNGNQSRFAAAIGTSQQNISNWLRDAKPLPPELVLKAEEVTGISRHEWRADIYPPAAAVAFCGVCELRADHPEVRSCTSPRCGLHERAAA